MQEAGKDIPITSDEAFDALSRLLASEPVAASQQIQQFIRYVVHEEVEERGDRIKAYTVAVDALGRDAGFDPSSDATVRVLAGRARTVLESYYAGSGAGDPVRIELKKGSYRPRLVRQSGSGAPSSRASPPSTAFEPAPPTAEVPWTVVAMSLVVVVTLIALWQFRDTFLPSIARLESPPIIEIMPFETGGDADTLLAAGIRQQLIVDMSRFESLRVRALPQSGSDGLKPGIEQADYRVGGTFFRGDPASRLSVTATRLPAGDVVWSDNVKLPSNDAEFQQLLYSTVQSIVTRLASTSGAIHTEAMAQLRARAEELGNTSTSNYECVLHYYAYDLTKSAAEEEAARTCLSRLTAAGSRDSSIWASWAFLQFLDWTSTGQPTNSNLFRSALSAANTAIQLDPYNATAAEAVGSIELAAGNRGKALEYYQRAIELNPSKPDLYVLLGWHKTMNHNWNEGIPLIRQGIALSPAPAGWMRIPLSIDAFRRGEYLTALQQAETIMQSGDSRGIVLGLAAAVALNNEQTTARLLTAFEAHNATRLQDPMREIRNIFNVPNIMARYERMLARQNIGPATNTGAAS